MAAEEEAFGGAAPYFPEDKAGLLAAVSGAAPAQSLAYLRVLYEACWAIRRTQFHPEFGNSWWQQKMQKHVEDIQKEEDMFFSRIMVYIFQGIPSAFRRMDDKFEKSLGEFISFLQSGSGPLSPREAEIAGSFCSGLLWLCQDLPPRWGEIARVQNERVVGQLPGWLHIFDILGTLMERDVQEQRKIYPVRVQSSLKDLDNAMTAVYQQIRSYYSQQPQDSLAPAVCVILSAWYPMTLLIGISPAADKSKAWDGLKRYLTQCAAYIKSMRAALGDGDKRSSSAAGCFAFAARAIVNEDGVKELIAFESVWLAYGKMLQNITNTFCINPAAKARTDLILDLEDARDYWFAVKGYIHSFPNLKPIEDIVEASQLP